MTPFDQKPKVVSVPLMTILWTFTFILAVGPVSAQQTTPDAVIPSLELKDGRVFKDARVVSQTQLSVLIRYAEGATSVNKALLPESVLARIDPVMFASIKAKETDAIETREAAARGDVDAEVRLGEHYFEGEGVPKSGADAIRWLTKAAEKGNSEAEFDLGLIYEHGDLIQKNAQLAATWYRKAAEQGDTAAENNLGLLFVDGEGVPRDAVEAVKWFRLAAERGDASAQFNLGMRYKHGEGVAKNPVEALAWFGISSNNGSEEGQAGSKSLANELGEKKVAIAGERSADLRELFAAHEAAGSQGIKPTAITSSVKADGKGKRSVAWVDSIGRKRTEWSMFFSAETWEFVLYREVHRDGETESKPDKGLLTISYDDLNKVADFLRKSKDWASSVRIAGAPDFQKEVGSTFNGRYEEEYDFWWNAGGHHAHLSTPGLGIEEEDFDSVLTLLLSAKDVAREQLEDADVAAAFAYKLK